MDGDVISLVHALGVFQQDYGKINFGQFKEGVVYFYSTKRFGNLFSILKI